MKLGIVYTSTTPELIECVNEEFRKNLGDAPEILNYQDPSILAEVREHGYVTAGAAARLVGMYMQAVSDGADAGLNCCSSVARLQMRLRILAVIPVFRLSVLMRRCAARQPALAREWAFWLHCLLPWNQLRIQFPVWQER